MVIQDETMVDSEYDNIILEVGDNKDPYGNKIAFINTYGSAGLTEHQVDKLINKLIQIKRKYREER